MLRFARLFTALSIILTTGGLSAAAGKAAHVVVVVWDGMRPDFVNEHNTPALFKLAQQGVTFANHHPVYVSSTEVNCAALATGAYPEQSGIIGNNEFRPAIDPSVKIMTAALKAVQRGDELSGNHFLEYPTIAETLRRHHLGAVIAGAKSVTLLQDRRADNIGALDIDVFEGNVLPESFAQELKSALGPFPPVELPKRGRDLWTTRALLGPLWEKGVPAFSLLWLSEPDYSQHKTGPGSKTSLEAIKSSDDNLARVLKALDRRGVRAQTDVIVVSDHAFSTIADNPDVAAVLNRNGFHAARAFSAQGPQPGEIMVVGNGGAVFLYVTGHEQQLIEKLVHFLQTQPFSGVLFARNPIEGAFTLDTVKLNSPAAPDVVVSLKWTRDKSKTGAPGMVYSDVGEYGPGQGMHATLSPLDMHNTCIAAGPDFRRRYRDELPTGNIDIAPTVLAILGVVPEKELSGRVLNEAFAGSQIPAPAVKPHHLETSYSAGRFRWRQYLDSSEVEGVTYFTEGNGQVEAQPKPAGN
ncbi:MAG TPA: alkaline phosphatase family protein [Candidatus Acidoferrum sp.]|jgi:predicted AlkP superfamily pyrophosphatase or phosphodiesterase|nr:alkaline phosphatase family protein [Candidatus Acidoferrum sp.]